jgi:hypothetical protein
LESRICPGGVAESAVPLPQEISSRILSNACNIVMDAADEEVARLTSTGMSSSNMDKAAYEHLIEITNMMIHHVLRKLVSRSVRTYVDIVEASAELLNSQPLFFTNLEEASRPPSASRGNKE